MQTVGPIVNAVRSTPTRARFYAELPFELYRAHRANAITEKLAYIHIREVCENIAWERARKEALAFLGTDIRLLPYVRQGFVSRTEYLRNVADNYGVSFRIVAKLENSMNRIQAIVKSLELADVLTEHDRKVVGMVIRSGGTTIEPLLALLPTKYQQAANWLTSDRSRPMDYFPQEDRISRALNLLYNLRVLTGPECTLIHTLVHKCPPTDENSLALNDLTVSFPKATIDKA